MLYSCIFNSLISSIYSKKCFLRTSLVVQWVRFCRGHWAESLIGELDPTYHIAPLPQKTIVAKEIRELTYLLSAM